MKTNPSKSPIVVVLAMHGIPPKDFPRADRKAFFDLRAAIKHAETPLQEMLDRRDALEKKMRLWPRTFENDPFQASSISLGTDLARQSTMPVVVGFNEFCAPDLDEAILEAVGLSSQKVVVTTPMMTRGGSHSKGDIPEAIARVQSHTSEIEICYAWPFPESEIAGFLAQQIQSFLSSGS